MYPAPALHVVMYHYVRDLARTPYPRLKAMPLDDFRRQIDDLPSRYEMATLDSALEYLAGAYQPRRALCLLTFDDGLKEHWRDVVPLLADRGIQGLFFLVTGCVEEGAVASVHMNHFLMAALDFHAYQREFLRRVAVRRPEMARSIEGIDAAAACASYRWDTPEVARFKYFFNFVLVPELRDTVVRELFAAIIGPEAEFSRELYLSWEEARAMQSGGMILGGHSHRHRPLATLDPEELRADLATCRELLRGRLCPQRRWPFCYPYGKHRSFHRRAVNELARQGFACAFTTETGINAPGTGRYVIRRVDCKDALPARPALMAAS